MGTILEAATCGAAAWRCRHTEPTVEAHARACDTRGVNDEQRPRGSAAALEPAAPALEPAALADPPASRPQPGTPGHVNEGAAPASSIAQRPLAWTLLVDRQPPVDLPRSHPGQRHPRSHPLLRRQHLRYRYLAVLPAVHALHPGTHLGAGRQHRRLRRRICAWHRIPILLLSLRGLHRTYARVGLTPGGRVER